jgi:hypothetical protein
MSITISAPQPVAQFNFTAHEISLLNESVQALQSATASLYIKEGSILLAEETDTPYARVEIFNDGEDWVVVPINNNLPENPEN